MLLESGVWNSHVLRPGDNHARAGLINVVFHAEVSGHAMNQHSVVRGHVRELVADLLLVLRELDQIFLDLQQHRAIFLITINGFRNEMLEIDPRAVGVQFRAAISREARRRAIEATLRGILMPQLVP